MYEHKETQTLILGLVASGFFYYENKKENKRLFVLSQGRMKKKSSKDSQGYLSFWFSTAEMI